MIRKFICAAVFGVLMISLGGCQSTQELAQEAAYTCQAAGLRPGTKRFARCTNANYAQNRYQDQQTDSAVATGVAAGVLGAAVIGAAVATPTYGYGYYGPGPYGPYGYGYYGPYGYGY